MEEEHDDHDEDQEDGDSDDDGDYVNHLLERIAFASRRDDDSSYSPENEPGEESEQERYDRTLAGQHAYLGCGREVSGRTILDENEIISLPLMSIGNFNEYALITCYNLYRLLVSSTSNK